MNHEEKTILVTGGAGFIGTNFIRYALSERPRWKIVNLDSLTYAGNPPPYEPAYILRVGSTFWPLHALPGTLIIILR